MEYQIEFTDWALADVQEHKEWLDAESKDTRVSAAWTSGLFEEIDKLAWMPRRFRRIPEANGFQIELRQFVFHSHRVVYAVDDETRRVIVITIFHSRRANIADSIRSGLRSQQ